MANVCPSPRGTGLQAFFSNTLLTEKLLKLTPSVPTNVFPPHPPESSSWLFGFSSTLYAISTVLLLGLGIMLYPAEDWNFSGSKCPIEPSSLIDLSNSDWL